MNAQVVLIRVAQGVLIALGCVAFLSDRERSVTGAVLLGSSVISQAILTTRTS